MAFVTVMLLQLDNPSNINDNHTAAGGEVAAHSTKTY